jgi:hypothetical protein
MRHRAWYGASLVLFLLGLVGTAIGYPLSPSPEPALVGDTYHDLVGGRPGEVTVERAGTYAIWESGKTRPDRGRCRVAGPDGAAIPVTAPRVMVQWYPTWGGDATGVWTEIATFDAPRADRYTILCAVDPAAPGRSFEVTDRPNVILTLASTIGGAVALVAAAAIGVTTFVRRRRWQGVVTIGSDVPPR